MGTETKGPSLVQDLVQEHVYHFVMDFGKGLVTHRHVDPGLFVDNALLMGKSVKSCLSVVGTQAALTDAAEAHIGGRQMDNGVIHAAAAEGAGGNEPADSGLVFRKDIESQGLWLIGKQCGDFRGRAVGQDRQ